MEYSITTNLLILLMLDGAQVDIFNGQTMSVFCFSVLLLKANFSLILFHNAVLSQNPQ